MPVSDEIREAAIQAAREAVAKHLEATGWRRMATGARNGAKDDDGEVAAAIRGALAALEAARPLIRAEALREAAAGVAQDEESDLRGASLRAAERPDIFPGLARERELQAVTAKEIMLAILALAQQETDR